MRVVYSHIVSNEVFAHTALEELVGKDKELYELSFNLLVTVKLEIILSPGTPLQEYATRLQVLRK